MEIRGDNFMQITDFKSYKLFLLEWLKNNKSTRKALKSELALALQCRLSYLSRVLNGDAHLSPEQAFRCTAFIGLTNQERKVFLLLVDCERASTQDLRDYLARELKELKKSTARTKFRLEMDNPILQELQAVYYSSWQYPTAHMALTVPHYQSKIALCRLLHVSPSRLEEILNTLQKCGLVKEVNGELVVIERMIHGDQATPNASRHLVNWRHRAIEAAQSFDTKNFHYSGVVSLSQADFSAIREYLISCLERTSQVIRTSKEETIAAINFDWFEIRPIV